MYFYIVPSDKDAMHHGILGMKWGVRRYQPYSVVPRGSGKGGKEIGEASQYGKGDVKAAKKNVKKAYKEIKRTYKKVNRLKQIEDKTQRLKELYNEHQSGIDHKKEIQKLGTEIVRENAETKNKKYDKALNRYNDALNQLKDADIILGNETNNILNKSSSKGKKILSIAFGNDVASMMLNKSNTAKNIAQDEIDAERNRKEHLKSNNIRKNYDYSKGLSSENKDRIERAKKTGMYSLDFLESIQNSKILDDGNDHEILKEYNKYLKNPEKYWKEDRHKLKNA